jgi:hypothetical protein
MDLVAIDADTKLVPSFLLGNRDSNCARMFMHTWPADLQAACN